MNLFKYFKILQKLKRLVNTNKTNEFVPSFWEDDYCQIEIVPKENREYIINTIKQINNHTNTSNSGFGFTKIFERGKIPITTISKEIRVDYLQALFIGFGFVKAKSINYDKNKIIDCETDNTKAYGFNNFSVFFETQDEYVKNIWLTIGLIVSVKQYDLIKEALYSFGEECEMVLVDWNSLEIFDLRDRNQIDNYLRENWK